MDPAPGESQVAALAVGQAMDQVVSTLGALSSSAERNLPPTIIEAEAAAETPSQDTAPAEVAGGASDHGGGGMGGRMGGGGGGGCGMSGM